MLSYTPLGAKRKKGLCKTLEICNNIRAIRKLVF